MIRRAAPWLLATGALLSGCSRPAPPPATHPDHYVGEAAWQGDNAWFYPRETYELDQTGLAAVYGDTGPALVTDGEAWSNAAMAAGLQTTQLPAIAQVTNLENGRVVRVRVNDHAPATPHRLVELTRTAALLLGIPPGGTAQVRVQLDGEASRALTAQNGGGAPRLEIATAPRGDVVVEQLGQPGRGRTVGADVPSGRAGAPGPALPPVDLPAVYSQGAPSSGTLWIRAGEFTSATAADRQRAELGGDATVERLRAGRAATYRVKSGPYPDPATADSALDAALRAGVVDARIVVE